MRSDENLGVEVCAPIKACHLAIPLLATADAEYEGPGALHGVSLGMLVFLGTAAAIKLGNPEPPLAVYHPSHTFILVRAAYKRYLSK